MHESSSFPDEPTEQPVLPERLGRERPEGEEDLSSEGFPTFQDTTSPIPRQDPAEEPTLVDHTPPPYQTDFQPGEPYPQAIAGDIHANPDDRYQSFGDGFMGSHADDDGGFHSNDYIPSSPAYTTTANGWLIALSGVLIAIILIGGGYIFFQTNKTEKTSQQQALEAAQSERDAARLEAQKAQEEAQRARAEAAQREEELRQARARASAEAARAASLTPTTTPTPTPTPTPSVTPSTSTSPRIYPSPQPSASSLPEELGKPLGNGCTPGTDRLRDGSWYGYVWNPGQGALDFDLVCLYEDGTIINRSNTIRSVPVDSSITDNPAGDFVRIDIKNGSVTAIVYD